MKTKELIKTRFRKGTQWELGTVLKIADRHDCKMDGLYVSPYNNTTLTLDCTVESYAAFAKDISEIYPGVCDFDVASIYDLMKHKD